MLNTIEFKAKIKQGMIEIPQEYQQDLKDENEVHVMVIKPEKITIHEGQEVPETTEALPEKSPYNRPIWDIFEEVADSLPEEIIADLPTDGASQHDHYLYGSPKQ